MSRSESKSAGAARKKIQETGVAHGHAHSSMSKRKNEPKTAHVAENCSRRKFLHEGALFTASPRCVDSPRSVQLTMVKAVKRLRRRRKREKNEEIRGVRR